MAFGDHIRKMGSGSAPVVAHRDPPVRVCILHPQDELRQRLVQILNAPCGYHCVGSFSPTPLALSKLADIKPDLLLSGIQTCGVDGFDELRKLHDLLPESKNIVIFGQPDAELRHRALDLGVLGLVVHPFSREEILDAMMVAIHGGIYLDSRLAALVANTPATHRQLSSGVQSKLTAREKEVLELLAEGLPYKLIALKLNISDSTVNNHLANIRGKLGVHNAIEALNRAYLAN